MKRDSSHERLWDAQRGAKEACRAITIMLWAVPILARAPVSDPPWEVDFDLVGARTVPADTLHPAEAIASKMLSAAGVRVHWNSGSQHHWDEQAQCATSRLAIQIVFAHAQSPGVASREALAYTYPYANSAPQVVLNYDQMPWGPQQLEPMSSIVLAHVLVHETTHVLQRISRHSDTGIMKARWSLEDHAAMRLHPLPFAPEDLVLIHLGRLSWERSLCKVGGTVADHHRSEVNPALSTGVR
jgi:hypothetical protein